jgi:hypothetical protein
MSRDSRGSPGRFYLLFYYFINKYPSLTDWHLVRYSKTYRSCLAELKAKFKEEVLRGLTSATTSTNASEPLELL